MGEQRAREQRDERLRQEREKQVKERSEFVAAVAAIVFVTLKDVEASVDTASRIVNRARVEAKAYVELQVASVASGEASEERS